MADDVDGETEGDAEGDAEWDLEGDGHDVPETIACALWFQ